MHNGTYKKRAKSPDQNSGTKLFKRDINRKVCPQELLVKLTRNTKIEQLLKQDGDSKNMTLEWPGWETPNFRLLKTKQHLQQLIGKIKQPLHEVLSTQGKYRVEQNGSQFETNISTELEVNDAECLQEYSCFCGFDHDPMMGPFRGWEKVNTKDRDYFNQLVRRMQMNLCLDNVLDEVTIWPFNEITQNKFALQEEQNSGNCLDSEMANKVPESHNMTIQQYLKTLMGFVDSKSCREPPFSYFVLAIMAIKYSPTNSVPLDNILQVIHEKFPYYRSCNASWTKSLERTIKCNDEFKRACPESCNKCHHHTGCWSVDNSIAKNILARAINIHNWKERGNLCLRTSLLESSKQYTTENKLLLKKQHVLRQTNESTTNWSDKDRLPTMENRIQQRDKDVGDEGTYHNIQLILKAAANLEVDNLSETTETKDVKLSCLNKGAADIKMCQSIKTLMGCVAGNPLEEPPFSYLVLVVMAIKSSAKASLTLNEIFQFIREKFPYYQSADDRWTTAAERTIHWNPMFMKICQTSCNSKRSEDHGGCWYIDPVKAQEILDRAVESYSEKEKMSNENNGRISECDEHQNATIIVANSPSLVSRKRHCGDNVKNLYKKASVLELSRYDYSGKLNSQSTNHSDNESVSTDSGTYCKDLFDLQPWQETSIPEKCSDGYQRFHCQDCNSKFVCLFYLKHHKCSEYSTSSEYPCYICHSKFSDKNNLSYHLELAHKGVVNKHTTSSTCWTIKHCSVMDTNCPFRCSICPAEFPNKEILEAHIKFTHC